MNNHIFDLIQRLRDYDNCHDGDVDEAADVLERLVCVQFVGPQLSRTSRGFDVIPFCDFYNHMCSLQKSSLADEQAIWFGVDGNRMHLTRNQVKALLPYLINFAETGELS